MTVIDHNTMKDNKNFISYDASDIYTSAVMFYSESLQTAQPIAFELQQLWSAELNYSVYEKELLSIIYILKK